MLKGLTFSSHSRCLAEDVLPREPVCQGGVSAPQAVPPASAEVGPAGSRLLCYCWDSMGICLGLRVVLRLTKGTVPRLSLWKKLKCSFTEHSVYVCCLCCLPATEAADWKPNLAASAGSGPLLSFAQ